MILYKLEWGHSFLYVGARNIPEAISTSVARGYTTDPLRVLTIDTDLVVSAEAAKP